MGDEAGVGTTKKVGTYPVAVHESEEGFCVWVPGMPGCVSQGDTEEDALANIADAFRDYVEVALDNGPNPPVTSTTTGTPKCDAGMRLRRPGSSRSR